MKSTIIQTKLLRNLKKWRLFSLLTCLTLFLSPAGFGFWPEDEELAFSNGALAFAYPLSGITIDGDPSDWPQDLKRYPIQESVLDNKPKDNQDFEAYFQVGYELASQSIFVMVSIHDDDYVVNSTDPGDWLNQDSFNFYIDGHHNSAGSGLTLYQFNEKFRQIFNPEGSWDPTTNITTWEHLDYKIRRDGQKIYYELKVNIGKDMKVGKAVGMDFVIIDKDEDDPENFSFMTWGKGNGKSRSFGNLGDLFLMKDKGITPGQLSGKIAWADTSIAHTPDWLRVQSLDEKNLWLDVKTIEETGSFQVDLPPGNYEIKSYRSLYYIGDEGDKYKVDPQKSRVKVKVLSGKKTEASDLKLFKIDNPDIIPPKGILADFDPNKPQQVDNFIETYQKFYEIPGVSLALIKDGKLAYHKTYGYKNNFTKEPVDGKTLFEAASISKPVFTFAVLRLAERGIIDLDKPLYQYLPFEAIAYDERYKLITGRHVLSHQTGFPNWAYNNPGGKLDIKFTPGEGYGYSGEGFEYLKRVVAHITQKDMDDVLQEEVLDPMGLEHTYYSKTDDYMQQVVAHGHYNNLPTRAVLPTDPGAAWSMHTEAKIFTNFMLGVKNRKGLKPETYAEMFKKHTEIPEEDKGEEWEEYFGLGLYFEKAPHGLVFQHGGNNGDFKCLFKMYEDLNMGFAIFTNSEYGDELAYKMEELLVTGKKEKKQ